jgi:putative ABC transport system substrate-binding protein
MKRREFITLIGGAAAWPLVARGQPAGKSWRVGQVIGGSPATNGHFGKALEQRLTELGYRLGQNLILVTRFASPQLNAVEEAVRGLINDTDLLVVWGTVGAMAAKKVAGSLPVVFLSVGAPVDIGLVRSLSHPGGNMTGVTFEAATETYGKRLTTDTIPIVFSTASDPVQLGLVASLNRPGGNATGVFVLANSLDAKRLELIHELIPNANLAVLLNPEAPGSNSQLAEVTDAASKLAQKIMILNASTDNDLQAASAVLGKGEFRGLLVTADPFFNSRRERLVEIAARHALPAIYEFREFAAVGGLITYGTDLSAAYREIGLYTGRILKGEKPSDLPVLQPTKFELVINLKTAKALGLDIPPTLLARADEVIE